MSRKYAKVEILSEEMFRRKAARETNQQIRESYGLTKKQVKIWSIGRIANSV